jgi:hypothetical protein
MRVSAPNGGRLDRERAARLRGSELLSVAVLFRCLKHRKPCAGTVRKRLVLGNPEPDIRILPPVLYGAVVGSTSNRTSF